MFPVDQFQDSLMPLVEILNRLSVRFHITGGAAAIAYSEPRLTQDFDVVIDREQLVPQIDQFLGLLEQTDFTFEQSAIRLAIRNGKSFQLLDAKRILKLDLYPRELIA